MKQLLAAVLLVVATQAPAQTPETLAVKSLSFLSGCWTTPKGITPEIRECYTAPYAGTMQSSSQTVENGRTTHVEFISIRDIDGTVIYAPILNGKSLSTFRLSKIEGQSAVFDNPQNDFPKRILYRRNGDNTLTITLEGTSPNDPGNQTWTMRPQGM